MCGKCLAGNGIQEMMKRVGGWGKEPSLARAHTPTHTQTVRRASTTCAASNLERHRLAPSSRPNTRLWALGEKWRVVKSVKDVEDVVGVKRGRALVVSRHVLVLVCLLVVLPIPRPNYVGVKVDAFPKVVAKGELKVEHDVRVDACE